MKDLFINGFSFGFLITSMSYLAGMSAKKVFYTIIHIIK